MSALLIIDRDVHRWDVSQLFWKSKAFASLIASNAVLICMSLICPNGSFSKDGQNSEDIQQAAQQLRARWVDFCALLAERLAWLAYQTKVLAFYNLFQQLEQAVATAENWLKVQSPPACEPEPLRIQLERCRVTTSVCPRAWGLVPLWMCVSMYVCSVSIYRAKSVFSCVWPGNALYPLHVFIWSQRCIHAGHFIMPDKRNIFFSWSFEIKELDLLWKHAITFRTISTTLYAYPTKGFQD